MAKESIMQMVVGFTIGLNVYIIEPNKLVKTSDNQLSLPACNRSIGIIFNPINPLTP